VEIANFAHGNSWLGDRSITTRTPTIVYGNSFQLSLANVLNDSHLNMIISGALTPDGQVYPIGGSLKKIQYCVENLLPALIVGYPNIYYNDTKCRVLYVYDFDTLHLRFSTKYTHFENA